jgi:2,4-dienoyl-CoA reductase-like NADH-dependent reductase (Old Yellow Enzyme family)
LQLSPLCQYSSDDGHLSDWHVAHLGGIAQRGPGLVMVEATAVLPEGRITPQDSGLWKESQVVPLRRVIDFVHSQNQIIGVQLAHAGRKASTVAPWLSSGAVASEQLDGWPDNVKGPSDVPHSEKFAVPKAMTKHDISQFKKAWVAAVRRAIKAGADFIEIHAAHGFLLFSFLSPISNKRTDEYGGSFQNRIRLSLEIAALTRQVVGLNVPVFLRISATEWLEESLPGESSWCLEDTIRFAQILSENGDVDLLDVSSGGNHPAQKCPSNAGAQAALAIAIKKIVGDKLAVAAVGEINSGEMANRVLEEGNLDLTLAGHGFLKNPGLVWAFADELDVEISMANQIRWAFPTRRGGLFLKKSIDA